MPTIFGRLPARESRGRKLRDPPGRFWPRVYLARIRWGGGDRGSIVSKVARKVSTCLAWLVATVKVRDSDSE